MDNSNANENVLPNIKIPKEFYVILAIILFLIVCLCLIFFKVNIFKKQSNSEQEITNNIFIIFFFSLIIFGLCYLLLPNIKDLKKLFNQINTVTYFILYTIGIILYFGFMPSDMVNEYAYIIVPVIAVLGIGIFYLSTSHSYVENFNINYERIKMILLFFCLITIFIVLYSVDPGGYISQYFGPILLLAILMGVFSLLYLIIVLTLPDNATAKSENNLLYNKFSAFSNYLNIGFFIFIISVVMMVYFSGGIAFFENMNVAIPFTVLTILISILWLILISVNTFPEIIDKSITINYLSLFKRSLLTLFSIIVSCIVILWIVYSIKLYSGKSSIASILLSVVIVVIVLGLIYKTVNVKMPTAASNNKKNAFFNLILQTILYIPCCFSGIFDSIGKMLTGSFSGEAGSLLMLLIAIVLIIVYFRMPSIFNIVNKQGGQQLVNKPLNTDTQYALGTYETLNNSDEYNYDYALSFWVFINAAGPNMNQNYSKNTTLLNYAGKPNVQYNGKTNTLIITMAEPTSTTKKQQIKQKFKSKLIDYDEDGNRILYVNNNFLLQKWNNIIINYSGGTLDIFLNGELVKSNIGVVPYYTLDNLTIGENGGIEGGICNVVYFRKPLTTTNIYFLYNMVKKRSPPVLNESNTTILVNSVQQIN
jgi:hypothetical protein